MKRNSLILIVLLSFIMTARAGKIVTDSLKSDILNSFVKFNVYLPNGFDKTNSLYPVVYLLHGIGDSQDGWQKNGNMSVVADELIESGEAKEMVIVMPCAGIGNALIGYFNMPKWDYEDFFFSEFIPAVESKYRIIGDKWHRAVMGLSMGGGGSTVYCQRHPEMFSSCYAMSAWLYQNLSANENKSNKVYYTRLSVSEHNAVAFLKNASDSVKNELKTVAWYFDCGDDDGFLNQSYEIYMKMRDLGIKSQLTVRNGSHNWEYWHQALRIALPFASRNFK